MRFQQTIDHTSVAILPAVDILSNLPEHLHLYNQHHRLRAPLGIYNASVQECARSCNRVLDLLEDARLDKNSDIDLVNAYDQLLDALMEHTDDCLNILLCFFPDKEMRKKHSAVKSYDNSICFYRNHIGQVVNHIKHNQGRIRLVTMSNANSKVTGYFVEGVDSNGVLGPQTEIHKNGNDADLHHFVVPRQAETSCFMNELANSVGVRFRKELCGLAVLKSTRHSSMTSLAS